VRHISPIVKPIQSGETDRIDHLSNQIKELGQVLKSLKEVNLEKVESNVEPKLEEKDIVCSSNSAATSGLFSNLEVKKHLLKAILGDSLDSSTTALLNSVLIVLLVVLSLIILELVIKLIW
jgi:DNA-directed RNA polymerase beta subunit